MSYNTASRLGTNISSHSNRRIPRISSTLMRSIEIMVNGQVIGFLKNFNPSEGRKITEVREIGNEDMVELAPGGPENMTIQAQRALLNYSKIQQVFDDFGGGHSNKVDGIRSLMDANYPFDVIVLKRRHLDQPAGDPLDDDISQGGQVTGIEIDSAIDLKPLIIMDWFHECWMSSYKYTVQAQSDFVIAEDITINYTWRTGSFEYASPSSLNGNAANNYVTSSFVRPPSATF